MAPRVSLSENTLRSRFCLNEIDRSEESRSDLFDRGASGDRLALFIFQVVLLVQLAANVPVLKVQLRQHAVLPECYGLRCVKVDVREFVVPLVIRYRKES